MIACVTSIYEKTTDLCIWSLERNGFDVYLYQNESSLCDKLEVIYDEMEDDFVRVDADTIVNKHFRPENIKLILLDENLVNAWWLQYQTYDWFKQDLAFGGVQLIKKEALPALRDNVKRFRNHERPETELSRIGEFYEPRRFASVPLLAGLNGYKNDAKRVMKVKSRRGQSANYDFELASELDKL